MLSGVSVEYYAKLERGNLGGASDQVLDAVAAALRLDEAERVHLFDLARTASGSMRPRRAALSQRLPESVARLLDGMPMVPAYVRNRRLDILAANPVARALFCDVLHDPDAQGADLPNLARYLFLDPRSRSFYREWDTVAQDIAKKSNGKFNFKGVDVSDPASGVSAQTLFSKYQIEPISAAAYAL
jgi:transcriptional regulator with XRE-family HTH domain